MCASRLLRRSGVAVGLVSEVLNWRATHVYQVGIGGMHQEVDVLTEEWPGVQFIGCEPYPMDPKEYDGKLIPVAISDRIGQQAFYMKRRHADGSSMFQLPADQVRKKITVEVNTLDTLFPSPEGEHILLWLDCEGSEYSALLGAENFIKHVEVINIEITVKPNGLHWLPYKTIHDWLVDHGFKRQWCHTFRIPDGQLDCFYVANHLFNPDYCCDPVER